MSMDNIQALAGSFQALGVSTCWFHRWGSRAAEKQTRTIPILSNVRVVSFNQSMQFSRPDNLERLVTDAYGHNVLRALLVHGTAAELRRIVQSLFTEEGKLLATRQGNGGSLGRFRERRACMKKHTHTHRYIYIYIYIYIYMIYNINKSINK